MDTNSLDTVCKQGENFDENPVSQRFSTVELRESKLILWKENVKYTNWMGENPQILAEIFARI